jgi:hypothetical protein
MGTSKTQKSAYQFCQNSGKQSKVYTNKTYIKAINRQLKMVETLMAFLFALYLIAFIILLRY